MSDKKSKERFNVKKAEDYYAETEHSYDQDSKRLSQRGERSNLNSQLQTSYGKSTKKNELSKIISSKESSGSEFGGPGLSSKTVKTYQDEAKTKKKK
jgi:hypothetical protein